MPVPLLLLLSLLFLLLFLCHDYLYKKWTAAASEARSQEEEKKEADGVVDTETIETVEVEAANAVKRHYEKQKMNGFMRLFWEQGIK